MTNDQKKTVKAIRFAKDPQEAMFHEMQEISAHLEAIANKAVPELPSLTIPKPPDVQKVEILGAEVLKLKGEKGDQGDRGEVGRTGEPGQNGSDGKNGTDGRNGVNGKDGLNGADGNDGENGRDGSPDSAEDIRNKLELLDGDERLKIEAIKDLREELDKMKKLITQAGGVTGISGRGRIKSYDISSQLNGVLKTFTIPANWSVISVSASSFPGALRPIIDYTYTPSTITFTSEITAGGTLATGQTVIIVYEEA